MKLPRVPVYILFIMAFALHAIPRAEGAAKSGIAKTVGVVVSRNAASSGAKPKVDEGLVFNFHNVPLDTVLNYVSKAAGFIIIHETTVEGRIDVVSQNPLRRAQVVEFLNTILAQKGYAAVQNENTLKIVTLAEARYKDIPVKTGRDSSKVAKSDAMVTQVIPVRYAQATQLANNLSGLLPSYAVITTNESSNAIVLTATQSDIRRMIQIIEALDNEIAGTASMRVFKLQYADAESIASLIGDLYKTDSAGAGNQGFPGMPGGPGMPPGMPGMPPGMPGMPGGPGGGNNQGGSSDSARKAAMQVTAVAETRTNAIVVTAPEDAMASIEQLIKKLDISTMRTREIEIFPLRHADAQTMADTINNIYQGSGGSLGSQTSSRSNQSSGGSGSSRRLTMGGMAGGGMGGPGGGGPGGMGGFGGGPGGMGGFGGGPGGMGGLGGATDASDYDSALAVADVRTNSVVVNAEKPLREQVALMIKRLDADPAKEKKVFIYRLKNADPQKTAVVLQSMFGDQSRSSDLSTQQTNTGGIFSNSNSSNSGSGLTSNFSGAGSGSRSGGGAVPTGLGIN